jgi:hypothetical protein
MAFIPEVSSSVLDWAVQLAGDRLRSFCLKFVTQRAPIARVRFYEAVFGAE